MTLTTRTLMAAATAAALGLGAHAALAAGAEINFDGTLDNICTIQGKTDGSLAASGDARMLSSTLGSARSGSVDVIATGNNVLSFSTPVLTQSPAGYTGTPTLELQLGNGDINGWSEGKYEMPVAHPGQSVQIDARATDTAAFQAGSYRITTVVTCAPADAGV